MCACGYREEGGRGWAEAWDGELLAIKSGWSDESANFICVVQSLSFQSSFKTNNRLIMLIYVVGVCKIFEGHAFERLALELSYLSEFSVNPTKVSLLSSSTVLTA